VVLSERELIEIISEKEFSREQLKAMYVGAVLYKRGFNVIPVTSSGRPVSALIGVDVSSRLPRVKLLEGFIDVGFSGVAISNSSLPDNPSKLLYVVKAKRGVLDKYRALSDLVNSTVSWRRGECVEALVVVDRAVSSKLLSKSIKTGDVEVDMPILLLVAGVGVEFIREFDFNSSTLGIRELSEGELSSLLRELGVLRSGVLERSVEVEFKVKFKELDDAGVEAVKNTLLEVYGAKPEYRNDIVYCFTMLASNLQVSPESIARVVRGLLRESRDDNVEERVASMIAGLEDVNVDVEYFSKRLEEVLGVKLEGVKTRPAVRVKSLEEILREALGEERARVALSKILSELEAAEYTEVEGEGAEATLHDKLRGVIEKLPELIREYCNLDINEFAELRRIEKKAACIYKVVSSQFSVVKVPPKDMVGESALYAATGDLLYDIEEVVKPVVGALIAREGARRTLVGEVVTATYSTGTVIPWYMINPWEYLRLASGVLDLEALRLVDSVGYYFTYRLPVKIRRAEIDLIVSDRYNIEENRVYKYWRSRFDDENWDYLVSSLGTWLSPFRHRHIAFLIGPPKSGKSTLVSNLTRSIQQIVGFVSLRQLTGYTFGLEPLIGKQIVAYSERGETVLKNLDVINTLFGEQDHLVVYRKHKPAVTMRSLKAGFFSMNDPPVVYEYGGSTMAAFLDRLSIIQMSLPESYEVIPNLAVPMRETFKFLLWCRVQLERSNWEIKKMKEEELLDYLMRSTNSALQFLNDTSVVESDLNGRVRGTDLYEAYVKWCSVRGVRPMGRNNFYSIVATKYHEYTREGVKWFKGLRLKESGAESSSLDRYFAQ
jgi:hypothetical protein